MNSDVFLSSMQILYQNTGVRGRLKLQEIINNYFDEGNRAEEIIDLMRGRKKTEEQNEKNSQ